MPRSRSARNRFRDEDWDDVASAYRGIRKKRRPHKLYRDTDKGVFGGVCAGIANYLGIEPWIPRLLTITIAIFGGFFLVLIVYVILVIVVDPQPQDDLLWDEEDDEQVQGARPSTIRASPKLGLRVVAADFREIELRLRRIETYVTSPKYKLDRGFHEMG